MQGDLRHALPRGQFQLHFQPVVPLRGGPVSFEALLRWTHPKRGEVSPADFIPVAEDSGLIDPIGRWVLREACRQLAVWRLQFGPERVGQMAVNVSPLQLIKSDFALDVETAIRETGLATSDLILEVTESVMLEEAATVIESLDRLHRNGIAIALDDFGTGSSSLSYLRRLPLSGLKIDRSFVRPIGEDGIAEGMVRKVIELAHLLGLVVTAEGVETPGQLEAVRGAGCDKVQGYLISRPVPAQRAAEWLAERQARGPEKREGRVASSVPPGGCPGLPTRGRSLPAPS